MSKFQKHLVAISSLALISLGSACSSDSGSSSAARLSSQAIDGYIVGAQAYCDDVASGSTQAAGAFDCPANTDIARINGGFDVGYDETKVEGGIPFVGEMSAPATLGYVTPLSTLAVLMASDENGYNAELWGESVDALASALDQSSLDLTVDAANTMQLIRLNASIHQLVSGFTASLDDYRAVTGSLASLLAQQAAAGTSLPIGVGIDTTVVALNEQLLVEHPSLYRNAEELTTLTTNVQVAINEIIQAQTPQSVALVAEQASSVDINGSISINRDNSFISLGYQWWGQYNTFSLNDFEDSARMDGFHQVSFGYYLDYLRFDQDNFSIDADLVDTKVSLAMSIRSSSLGDAREFNLISHDVYLSAQEGDSSSLTLTRPENAVVYASGVSQNGVYTETSIEFEGEETFTSANGEIDISLNSARAALEELGYEDILAFSGDYEITFVISGLKIKELDRGELSFADQYTVEVGDQVVTGSGFRGYVSYLD